MDARTVSIWTVQGRTRSIAFTGHPDQLTTLERYRQGESDLVWRGGGEWFLIATVDIPDAEANTDPVDFLGIDMGIVNIATTSDGDNHAGAGLRRYRKRMAQVRAELQAKATKSAKRKLKARSRREARAVKDTNHRIAKQLVAVAERTGRGIGMEDLAGIRDRVRLTAAQRGELTRGPSINCKGSSPTRRNGPECRWSWSTRGIRRGGARGAGTPPRPTGLPETILLVSVADSLGPPTR
jgi:transposase